MIFKKKCIQNNPTSRKAIEIAPPNSELEVNIFSSLPWIRFILKAISGYIYLLLPPPPPNLPQSKLILPKLISRYIFQSQPSRVGDFVHKLTN